MPDPDTISDPPVSGSPYIIICNGRIGLQLAQGTAEQILVASGCATALACYMGLRHKGAANLPADLQSISVAQHWLMDNLGAKKKDVDAKIAEMFEMFDALEQKYAEVGYGG